MLISVFFNISIGNARLYHMERDIGLSSDQYFWSLGIFFIGYVVMEVPSNLMLKVWGGNRVCLYGAILLNGSFIFTEY